MVSFLEEQGVLRTGSKLADIGSGTGLSAKPFLEAGYEVVGVEPNDAMKAEGDVFLSQYPSFHSVKGTSEATTLPDHSIDVAIAAQAFHWFEMNQTRDEMQRILRPGGWFVAMWNHRNLQSSPFQMEYEAILRKYCPDYHLLALLYRNPERSARFFQKGYHDATLLNPQQLDWVLFEARIQSASYIPNPTACDYVSFMNEMKNLFEKYAHNGILAFDLEVWLHWGQLH